VLTVAKDGVDYSSTAGDWPQPNRRDEMNAYGTIHASVIYKGKPAKIGHKVWLSSRTPSVEEQTEALQAHLVKYEMELISVDAWSVASDYSVKI